MTKSYRIQRVVPSFSLNLPQALAIANALLTPSDFALYFRGHVMVAWLMQRPIRLQSLLGIEVRMVDEPNGPYELKMPQVKTNKIVGDLPECVSKLLREYVISHRPLIRGARADSGSLWIDSNGRPLPYQRARDQLTETLRFCAAVSRITRVFTSRKAEHD